MHHLRAGLEFLNRIAEIERLDGLVRRGRGFAAVYGRRRIGKTRMLVEWVRRHRGVYSVADQSTADIQRRYLAEAVATRLEGFADVEYPDWRALLTRLARDARAASWRGPLVLDELPYLVVVSPELPAVLQRWVDHEAGDLVVVVAGSSQHMMHGLVLSAEAPLFGRASEVLEIEPLNPRLLPDALGLSRTDAAEAWSAWGGVPRYWELAQDVPGNIADQIDRLVLDPLGPLHREPDRLIAEELPPANEVRALLDAIGGGAHRASEIGGRIGRPATSLSRPLQRLQGMGLVRREVPFGDDERSSKRSLYRISDPFTRLWFRVVAPHRGALTVASATGRRALLHRFWPQLHAEGWEDLCRLLVPSLGAWGAASRWWRGNDPEWDIVAQSLDGRRVLLGEAKLRVRSSEGAVRALAQRPLPAIPGIEACEVVRVLFVADGTPAPGLVTAGELLGQPAPP